MLQWPEKVFPPTRSGDMFASITPSTMNLSKVVPPIPPPKPKKKVKFLAAMTQGHSPHVLGVETDVHTGDGESITHSQTAVISPLKGVLKEEEVNISVPVNKAQVRLPERPLTELHGGKADSGPRRGTIDTVKENESPGNIFTDATYLKSKGNALTITNGPNKEEAKLSRGKPKVPPKPKIKKGFGWERLRKHLLLPEQTSNEKAPAEIQLDASLQGKAANGPGSSFRGGSQSGKAWDTVLQKLFAQRRQDFMRGSSTLSWRPQTGKLPLLLFRPRFDARRLRQATGKPARRLASVVFDLGLSRRVQIAQDERGKDFNRAALGWQSLS